MHLAQQLRGGRHWGRIGLTLYYGYVVVLAIRRAALILLGRGIVDEISYFNIALFVAFTLSSWWFLSTFRWKSDRIAAFLYGLFYVLRVVEHFARGTGTAVIMWIGCFVISVGMIAVIIGMVSAIMHSENSAELT